MFLKFKVRFWFSLQMFAWKRLQKYVWLPKPGGVIWTEIVAKPDNYGERSSNGKETS